MKVSRKGILNVIFLLLVFSLTLYFLFYGEDFDAVIGCLREADIRFWIVGVVFVVLFITGESVVICYLMRNLGQPVRLPQCLVYSFVGFFFSLITPSATGGQPAQLYFMRRDKLSITVSTMVLLMVTITYKMVLVVLAAIVLLFRPPLIMQYLQPVIGWVYLGIALNVICVGGMLLLVFHATLAENMLKSLVKLAGRLFHWKKEQKWLLKIDNGMVKYRQAAEYFNRHRRLMVNAFLVACVQRGLLFAVTFLAYRSFHMYRESFVTVTVLQGMISVAVDMLPLPGGMGISEKLFVDIFQQICDRGMTLPLLIASRGISFYTQLFLSAVMTAFAYLKKGKDRLEP